MDDCSTYQRCHEEVSRLLPWYVTARLDAEDAQRVTSHLERCATCRDDVTQERALRALLKSDSAVEYAPQPGLGRTLARIGEFAHEAPLAAPGVAPRAALRTHRFNSVHWLAAAALLQVIALGAVSTSLLHGSGQPNPEARYTTLSSAPTPVAPGSRIRVVFSPSMPLSELQFLLAQNALTVVHGPSDAGAYTLAFTDSRAAAERVNATIATLRRDTHVLFAEPAVLDESGGW